MTTPVPTPEVFLRHGGVTVYCCYKDGWCKGRKLFYWFTLSPTDSRDGFDIRDTGCPEPTREEMEPLDSEGSWVNAYEDRQRAHMARLIDAGRLP